MFIDMLTFSDDLAMLDLAGRPIIYLGSVLARLLLRGTRF